MRTSFELKLLANTYDKAKKTAIAEVGRFLGIPENEVEERVSMELKISYPKAESLVEIEQSVEAGIFQVTVFGSVKQSVAKPFGFDKS
jgi:hypothetical protein